jgi:hypothetical protein
LLDCQHTRGKQKSKASDHQPPTTNHQSTIGGWRLVVADAICWTGGLVFASDHLWCSPPPEMVGDTKGGWLPPLVDWWQQSWQTLLVLQKSLIFVRRKTSSFNFTKTFRLYTFALD